MYKLRKQFTLKLASQTILASIAEYSMQSYRFACPVGSMADMPPGARATEHGRFVLARNTEAHYNSTRLKPVPMKIPNLHLKL